MTTCPIGYFPNNTLSACTKCKDNCYSCSNYNYCDTCNSNYYIISYTNSTSCVRNCPVGYYTPTALDGTGYCGQCATNCYACIDASTCTQCIRSYDIPVAGVCTPTNCINCLTCFSNNNTCDRCLSGYFLSGSGCTATCPDRYFGDNSTGSCVACIKDCMLC